VFLIMLRAPAAPFVPAALQGERICAMAVCHSGAATERDAALAPLRALGAPAFDTLHAQPYTELQSYLDATEPRGHQAFWRTEYVAELREELLDTLVDLFGACPIPRAQVALLHLGGAVGDRAGDDGSVGNRDVRWIAGANGFWAPGEDIDAAWVRGAWERFRPFGTGATYVNFQTADEGADRRAASYGGNLERLRALKRRVDPDGMFRPLG
jgi:FAD/FMN-containing dehydrogenase